MSIVRIPLTLMRFQYEAARFPLQVIDDRFVTRLDSEAPARLWYERSLGLLDVAVGTALGAPELRKRGARLIDRSDALRRAAELDAAAAENVEAAEAELRATQEKAVKEKQEAIEQTEREARQARREAQDRKRTAIEDTEKRVVAEKDRVEQAAAERKKDVEAAKREEEAQIEAAERSAAAAADAKLDDARDKRVVATTARVQADRIEGLAEAEKENR